MLFPGFYPLSVTVAADPLSIPADGSTYAIITATLKDENGQPSPQGTQVTFTTDLGTFGNGTTYTVSLVDDSGQTAVFLRGTTAGTATVTATSEGVVSSPVQVSIYDVSPNAIALQATPGSVLADGQSTSSIRATVTDGNNNPVPDGTIVTFTVTTGTGSLSNGTATTTNGIATVTYTASTTIGTETVTAQTANNVSQTVDITLTGPQVKSVTVTSGSPDVIADGASYTLIFVTVTDDSGAVPDGTVVAFTTTAGVLSEETTTSDGTATAKLTSSTNRGAATVTATSGGVSGNVVVNFIAGPPDEVSVSANPGNLTADGAGTSAITVTVLDVNDNPVADGSTLTFSADSGTLNKLTATTTDGTATVTYTAPNSVPAGSQATITVVTTNGKSGAASITLIGPQIATISLSANPASLPADGSSTATITATLTVSGGGNPPDGTIVDFSITQGGGSITATATTANGVATATLTSAAAAGTATIQAVAGGRTAQINVDYTPGSVTVTIVPNSILGTGDQTSNVTALLKDASGASAPDGETVTFSLSDESLGTVTPATKQTSSGNGEAVVSFDAYTKGGTGTITASWTTGGVDVTGSADVVVQPPPSFMQVASGYPNPTDISIRGTGGQSTSQIVFDVKDASGNLVVDGYRVDFSILSGPNGGEEISPLFATTTNGKVSTILKSGSKSGPVSLKAGYHHDTNVSTVTSQITIVAGPPVGEEMGISAHYINVSGLYLMGLEDTITVSAGDIYGNAIPDNTALSFKTYNTGGLFSPGSSTTTGGTATNKLESVSSPSPNQGFLSVTGEAVNGGRTTHVTCLAVAPTSTNIIYAGTDGGGAYKSTNSGVTWDNISRSSSVQGQNWIGPYVNDIAVNPDNENIIYAATGYLGDGHLYRSLDGGSNWNSNHTEEYAGVFSAGSAVLAVLCDDDSNDYVWLGTDGVGAYLSTDGERNSFQVGGVVTPTGNTVEAGGVFNNTADTGTGTMTIPTLTINSKTEDWTVTYVVTDASATTPQAAFGNTGNGTMSGITTDNNATETEDWTVIYGATVGAVTGTGTTKGNVASIEPKQPNYSGNDPDTETWTLTCINAAVPATFSVESAAGGTTYYYINATVDASYSQDAIEFTIISGSSAYVAGEEFSFTTTASWQVSGTVSNTQSGNPATTGVAYTSTTGGIGFTITDGSEPFAVNDQFSFSTTASPTPYWDVDGTVSGLQNLRAANDTKYTSDNDEVSFTITEGGTPFAAGDNFTFSVTESGLGHGKTVRDIVKVPDTHGSGAVLYAATATGLFTSANGGLLWTETGNFTGDNLMTVALHPSQVGGKDIVYAGTNDAGVWVSADSGANWTQYAAGMGKGLSASTPVADVNNTGTGVMSAVTVGDDALSEYWTVECKTAAVGGGTFSVTGTVSGAQADYDISAGVYAVADVLSFTITAGSTDFAVGDQFAFATTRDPGRNIKALLVDEGNDRLYAVTYFWGPIEPHAVGNVYVIELDATTQLPTGSWTEANSGLPQYDPPDDTTLFAQHAIVSNIPPYNTGAATALYIGGEGINLYKATSVLTTGAPAWRQSQSGLTNLIMARMPVLFSGECSMSITETEMGSSVYRYTIYIEDANGNPPISGSEFTITTHNATGGLLSTVTNVIYPDTFTHTGTYRDPSDASTNIPYTVSIGFTGQVAEVKFSFEPTCKIPLEAPGCSGSDQTRSYFN